ncbi:MAG: PIN domain-containing protein [Thermoguttaceae bacterium]
MILGTGTFLFFEKLGGPGPPAPLLDLYGYDAVSCPEHYGRLRHEWEAKGQTIGAMDMLIAAHALALNAALVTNNDAYFSRVAGLRVVNWLKETAGSE